MKFTFSAIAQLRNEFFVQIKSHLHNFHQLSYSDLVIKIMNSNDMYLNYAIDDLYLITE